MPSKVCILDFETTGTDPLECSPLELAAVLVDSNEPWAESAAILETYFNDPKIDSIPPRIVELTGITLEEIRSKGLPPEECLDSFLAFSMDANYFMAHNAEYDSVVLANAISKYPGLKESFRKHPAFKTENWLCSIKDVPYADKYRCKILSHVALDHGVPIDTRKLHSALYDIGTLQTMLDMGDYTLEKILAYKAEPWVYMQAMVPPPWEDDGVGKAAAQKAGFSYQTCRGTTVPSFMKKWVKRVKKSKLQDEKKLDLPFRRVLILE